MSWIVFPLIAFALAIVIIAVFTRRVADSALTDQFRAAESIVEGRIPKKWMAQINRRMAPKRVRSAMRSEISGTKLALEKVDKLYRFFEKSPFFENAAARELLLAKLKETRQSWEKMTWEEIISSASDQYGAPDLAND